MATAHEVQQAFGQRLRTARRQAGMTQEQLALAANLDRSYVGQVERGERNVALINIARLAGALGLPPSSLLDDCPPISPGGPCT